jgi:transposase
MQADADPQPARFSHPNPVGLRRFGGHRQRKTVKGNPTMNKPVNEAKKVRQKFDKAFKERAVELWLTSGKAATEVAVELGIHPQRLSAWRTRFAPPPPGGEGGGGAKRSAAQWEAENARLRRENDYLRQQREILKKTLGILSEPPTSGSNGLTR